MPFDLKSLRFVQYLPNGEGLRDLKKQVTARLLGLLAKAGRDR